MRVDLEPIDLFVQLMHENRPCPACGSERITVQRQQRAGGGALLRAVCADCQRSAEVVDR